MVKLIGITATQRSSYEKKLKAISIGAREKRIFACKYGIGDGEFKSNKEVGERYRMTGEAVRLILLKVMKLINKK